MNIFACLGCMVAGIVLFFAILLVVGIAYEAWMICNLGGPR